MASLTGTAEVVAWGTGADPAGQTITVPADATAAIMFWSYYAASSGDGLASATLNSVAFDSAAEDPTEFSDYAGGYAIFLNPSTGSQTLDVAWDTAPGDGPITHVAYLKDVGTLLEGGAFFGSSLVLDSDTDGIVLMFEQQYGQPGLPTGHTALLTQTVGGVFSRSSSVDSPGATTTTLTADLSGSILVGVSFPNQAAAATGAASLIGSNLINSGTGR